MRIPRKLKIGGFIWRVIFSEEVSREGRCYGSTHFAKQKIYVDPQSTQQKQEQAFLHEILHAIWWQQGLCSVTEVSKQEECVVDALSYGLHQVLTDNKIFKEK